MPSKEPNLSGLADRLAAKSGRACNEEILALMDCFNVQLMMCSGLYHT
jgi:hypothetical protein